MELKYTYEQDGRFLAGYLDDYPEYPTQGETLEELEDALKEIFGWIQDGTLEGKNHGVLKIDTPNAETIAAIEEGRAILAGKIPSQNFKSFEEFWAALDS